MLRGFQFTHETVRDWEERFLPHFTDQIQTKRKGKIGKVWLIDETFVRVKGVWCYLYRGINEDGNLVDVRRMAEFVYPRERRQKVMKGGEELEALFQAA